MKPPPAHCYVLIDKNQRSVGRFIRRVEAEARKQPGQKVIRCDDPTWRRRL